MGIANSSPSMELGMVDSAVSIVSADAASVDESLPFFFGGLTSTTELLMDDL